MLLCEGGSSGECRKGEVCRRAKTERERFRLKALSLGFIKHPEPGGYERSLKFYRPLRRRVEDVGAAFGILTSWPASNSELTPTPFILAISSAETL